MKHILLLSICAMLISCGPKEQTSSEAPAKKSPNSISKSAFGSTGDGQEVSKYTLSNGTMSVSIITYGGIIQSIEYPDKDGQQDDVVLGHDDIAGYLDADQNPYFGGIIGRYGNRIAGGSFSIDGKKYQLAQNDGPNHLHGGLQGFDKVVWDVKSTTEVPRPSITLSYLSPDGQEGYPGTLSMEVSYTLTEENGILIDYQASTDKPTVVNLTNHTYFNLGADKSSILDHELSISADQYLPVDETLIPTGELRDVEGTPFDFTAVKSVGRDITTENEQLKRGLGYDHCWIFDAQSETKNRKVATLYDAESGRYMEVFTTEPAIQFYSGNFLDGTISGKNGTKYPFRSGLCLETQHYPDSPNQDAFPSTILRPGERYSTQTEYRFSIK